MNWFGEWWVFVLFAGLALLIGVAVYTRRSREIAVRAAAGRLGLIALRGLKPFTREELKGFNLFSRGNGRKWGNVFCDVADTPASVLFDFAYTFGIPFMANVKYRQTVAGFSARATGLPDFQLAPATGLDRIGQKLGFRAICFEGRPDFRKRYWLRGDDEIAIRALFRDSLLDRLAAADPNSGWYVEKAGRWLLVYRHGLLWLPQSLPVLWRTSSQIAELFLKPHG